MVGSVRLSLPLLSFTLLTLAAPTVAAAQDPASTPAPSTPTATPRGVVLVDAGTAFGNTEAHLAYTGGVGLNLGSHLEVVAEFGRFDNIVTKALANDVRDTAANLSLSAGAPVTSSSAVGANYGLAEVRLSAETSPRMGVYVEVGAGAARIDPTFSASGAGTDLTGQVLETVTDPVPAAGTAFFASVGGGFTIKLTDRIGLDAGYRFGRISTAVPLTTNTLYGGWRLGW